MSQNGKNELRSQILDSAGNRAVFSTMEPPAGQSPYFGWLGIDGLATVRVDAIQAMVADKNIPGNYLLILKYGAGMTIPGEDGLRLMRRIGWSEKSAVARATQ